jgi:solute:Na+ symporter, SSS family
VSTALAVLTAFFVVAIGLGLLARRGRDMNLEQWSVGGRGFGTIFVFLLMAGEIYTTFTFLGGSGWAYGKGAPAFYILCYGAIAYTLSYFLLPAVWRYGQRHQLLSQADYFAKKYESRALGVVVGIVGVSALVPYLVLQLKGLGIIVSEASYGSIAPSTAVWAGAAALVLYVVVSGVRGSAWTAVLKDVMILGVVVAIGVYLPIHYYGGYGPMFRAIERAHPGFLVLPARGMSPAWAISTIILSALGFYMWPQYFASVFTARSEDVFRKNAVVLPLYQLVILFVFFAGFAALLLVPGLAGADADLSLLRVSKATFGEGAVGVIGGAGLLTALVPSATDRSVAIVARALVPVVAVAAVLLTLRGGQAIVALLLMGYNLVTQLFPALALCVGRRRLISAGAAMAGIVAGELTVAAITISGSSVASLLPAAPQIIKDLNVGIVALIVNVVVLTVFTLARR